MEQASVLEAQGAHDNNLLACLRAADLEFLKPIWEVRSAQEGEVFFDPGQPVDLTYFPCGGSLVSFRVLLPDGGVVETGLVGREGAVGGIVSHGHLPAFARAIVQYPGIFLKIRTSMLEEAKRRSPVINNLFARYADCLLAQVFQATACNASHSIEQRTAKWILAAMDRTGDHTVPLTQEQLAGMLGVGRSYINRVLASWKLEKIVEWRRGQLRIDNLDALRRHQCSCNDAVRSHFDQVLKGVYPEPEA